MKKLIKLIVLFLLNFSCYSQELYPVRINGKWGYINKIGEVLIKPSFDKAYLFSDGLGLVQNQGKYGYINQLGKFEISAQYDEATVFQEGLATVSKRGERFYIDRHDEVVSKPLLNNALPAFSDSLIISYLDGKFGYKDYEKQQKIENRFSYAYPFNRAHAIVGLGDTAAIIDKSGNFKFLSNSVIIKPNKSENLFIFQDAVSTLLYGIQTPKGDIVLKPIYIELIDLGFRWYAGKIKEKENWEIFKINENYRLEKITEARTFEILSEFLIGINTFEKDILLNIKSEETIIKTNQGKIKECYKDECVLLLNDNKLGVMNREGQLVISDFYQDIVFTGMSLYMCFYKGSFEEYLEGKEEVKLIYLDKNGIIIWQ